MVGEDRVAGEDRVPAAPRPPLAYRLTSRQWMALDAVVAVLALMWIAFRVHLADGFRFVVPSALTTAIAIAVTLPAAVRRASALAVVAVAIGVLTATDRAPSAADVTLGMVVYMASVRLCRRNALIALIATEIVVGAGLLTAESRGQAVLMHSMLATAALWLAGDSVRERRRYLAGLTELTWQRQHADAERSRLAIHQERVRIARELHDASSRIA